VAQNFFRSPYPCLVGRVVRLKNTAGNMRFCNRLADGTNFICKSLLGFSSGWTLSIQL